MGFEPVKGLQCRKCGCTSIIIRRKYFSGGEQYHIGVYCSGCGAWIKWLPKSLFEEDTENGI